jgi:hypothetical protein
VPARCAPSTPTPRPATSATAGPGRRPGPRAPAAGRRRSCCTSGHFPGSTARASAPSGPALQWAAPASQPALEGLHVVASLLEPATNLRQDARQVAAIYRHFVTHTAPLVAPLPVFEAGRAVAGRLYRRGRFLIAHQGSLHIAALDGPRGRVAASAHNYILRRFASFFAVRRATLRALAALPVDVQRLAATSADPCLRQQAQEMARAS